MQLETTGRRGRSKDPLYRNRKTLLSTEHLLTDKQRGRLEELFDFDEDYAPLQETWTYYQQVISCYNNPNKQAAKKAMSMLIDADNGNTGSEPRGMTHFLTGHDLLMCLQRDLSSMLVPTL
ncbi:transposase, partial [Corynebacterium tuberculostearicum]|nr:transposase [Corynebacterium tuberculostearicum]